jgi:rhodanese-related sulfurtransferase
MEPLLVFLNQRDGFDRVSEIAGGISGWEAAKLPVQTIQALS